MLTEKSYEIIIDSLKPYKPESIALFGSYARGDQKLESDLDILVSFKNSISLLKLIHVENLLSSKLGIKVDLVTKGALDKKFARIIEKELISIYTND